MITETITTACKRDNWKLAYKLEDNRILVLKQETDRHFPYVVHYYSPDKDYYYHGVYLDNEIKALKYFKYVVSEYTLDKKLQLKRLKESLIKILAQKEDLNSKNLQLPEQIANLDKHIERYENAIWLCEAELEEIKVEMVNLVEKGFDFFPLGKIVE